MTLVKELTADEHNGLLVTLNLGASVAEDDDLLSRARVDTPAFGELLGDRIDIVRGTKGSGKTALFRIFSDFLTTTMLKELRTLMVSGVESTGDPVFTKYKPQFEQLDEIDFQSFWRIYFLSLINNRVFGELKHEQRLAAARKEIAAYRLLASKNGFPSVEGRLSEQGLVATVLSKIPRPKRVRVEGGLKPESGAPFGAIELDQGEPVANSEERTPVFVQELHESLVGVLEKVDLNVWIMLDRLDEVFERRSKVERVALRGLLRTTLSFRDPRLRIKVFLRDDIFDSVTDDDGGFVAMTHVKARSSGVLSWSKAQLLQLVVRRLSANSLFQRTYDVDPARLAADASYRESIFYAAFPSRIHSGKNQSKTMDWLYKHCEDGNGVVTPRDIIDLITYAVRDEKESGRTLGGTTTILSPAAIRNGYARMCKEKRSAFLKAEFPQFWPDLEKFEGQKAEQTAASLELLLGSSWEAKVKNLRSIGFLRFSPSAKTYGVPFMYRQCLGMRQGKALTRG